MMDGMTESQFNKLLKMVAMILDGCKDLDEAKKKVAELVGQENGASQEEE